MGQKLLTWPHLGAHRVDVCLFWPLGADSWGQCFQPPLSEHTLRDWHVPGTEERGSQVPALGSSSFPRAVACQGSFWGPHRPAGGPATAVSCPRGFQSLKASDGGCEGGPTVLRGLVCQRQGQDLVYLQDSLLRCVGSSYFADGESKAQGRAPSELQGGQAPLGRADIEDVSCHLPGALLGPGPAAPPTPPVTTFSFMALALGGQVGVTNHIFQRKLSLGKGQCLALSPGQSQPQPCPTGLAPGK